MRSGTTNYSRLRRKAGSLLQAPSVMIFIFAILMITSAVTFNLTINPQSASGHHVLDEIDVAGRPMKLSISVGESSDIVGRNNNTSAAPELDLRQREPSSLLSVSILGKPLVSIINTLTDNITRNINTTSAIGGVFEVEAIPEKNKVYAAPFEGGQLGVYDLQSGNLLKAIELPNAEHFFEAPHADRVIKSVTLLTGAWSVDYNPNNELLYVANYNGDQIVIIDTKTDSVVGTISGLPAHPITVKVDPITNTVLVASLAGNKVTFISADTNKIEKTIETGTAPWGMDLDHGEHLAYVTNRGSNFITVLDLIDQKIVAKIPIAAPAQAITVDDKEHTVYTSYMEQDKVLKIDGVTNTILSTIDMGLIPQDLAVDPNTQKVYSSTKYNDKVYVMGPESISDILPVISLGTTATIPAIVVGEIRAHGQDVQVSEPYLDINNKSLIMTVNAPDGGDLSLTIPRNILDAREKIQNQQLIQEFQQQQQREQLENNNNNQSYGDTNFQLLIDGNTAPYDEQHNTIPGNVSEADTREISFYIPPNSKSIEIIGTDTIMDTNSTTVSDTK